MLEEGEADSIPAWFVKGRTILIPKEGCQGRPDPITCLNTGYKLLTAVMTKVSYEHVTCYSYLPPEQKAIRKGKRECVDVLMIDSMIAKEASIYRHDLPVAWIDYQKAYDRVPHDWIRWMLSVIKAPFSIQYAVSHLKAKWNLVFCVGTRDASVKTELTF